MLSGIPCVQFHIYGGCLRFCYPSRCLLPSDTLIFLGATISLIFRMTFHLCPERTCNSDLSTLSLAFSWPKWLVNAWAHGPVRSIETPAVIIKGQALSFTVLKPGRMQAWSIWQQSCHHEGPKKQRVWYHWSLEITMSEMSIFLDFFVMWSNKGLSFLSSALSWLKGPVQCNIPSTTTTSHPL